MNFQLKYGVLTSPPYPLRIAHGEPPPPRPPAGLLLLQQICATFLHRVISTTYHIPRIATKVQTTKIIWLSNYLLRHQPFSIAHHTSSNIAEHSRVKVKRKTTAGSGVFCVEFTGGRVPYPRVCHQTVPGTRATPRSESKASSELSWRSLNSIDTKNRRGGWSNTQYNNTPEKSITEPNLPIEWVRLEEVRVGR